MKFHFEQLDYQQRAAQSIAGVLSRCGFSPNLPAPALGNPVCDYAGTLDRIRAIRGEHGVEKHGEVRFPALGEPLNLDVMMETGTGKTFTFIDAIYRLNREYGLAKFVILVPSNAIRAGTMKNLDVTREFFFARYGRALSAYDYNESTIANFIGASNNKISVMVMSFAAFFSANRIINKRKLERNLIGKARTYMEAVAKLRPVIIIDEPHRAGGDKIQKYLPNFKAQIILRFGATFKGGFRNLLYAMDSATAFRRNLVKSITVNGVKLTSDDTLEYRRQNGEGVIVYASTGGKGGKITKPVRKGDNLGEVFGIAHLRRYAVEKLNGKGVRFGNGYFLPVNAPDSCSELRDEIRREILNHAIKKHFAKERKLFGRGVKALSLFFIDDVGAYLKDDNTDGELAKMFDALYAKELKKVLACNDLCGEYRDYLQAARGKVRGGYFAKSNRDKDNDKEINLILRNKEKLLGFAEPVRFIFSKWALREGWDNPNIFTLAKLAPSNSEITKLQQIGRGLRLPVNQNGRRMTEDESVLDVIVPGGEEEFVRGIQRDIDGASLDAGLNYFNNMRLMDWGVCPDQVSANEVLSGLKKLGLITVNRNYEAEVVAGSGELAGAKDDIVALAQEAQADAEKLIKFLDARYEARGKVKTGGGKGGEVATIRKDKFAEFRDAWQRINSKAVIAYDIDTPKLIKQAAAAIDAELNIRPVQVAIDTIEKAQFIREMITDETEYRGIESVGADATLGEFMRQLSAMTKLTRHTLAKILCAINGETFDAVKKNPKQAARDIARICIREINKLVLHHIGYDIVETRIKSTSLTDGEGNPKDEIPASALGRLLLNIDDIENELARGNSLYDGWLGYDSNIEKTTMEESGIKTITVFAKLPKVGIRTPVGEYNPDFAFVIGGGKGGRLYLVVETKGFDDMDDGAREREKQKTKCAEQFFDALDKHLSGGGVKIHFRKKLNHQALKDIIAEIRGE